MTETLLPGYRDTGRVAVRDANPPSRRRDEVRRTHRLEPAEHRKELIVKKWTCLLYYYNGVGSTSDPPFRLFSGSLPFGFVGTFTKY